MSGDGSPEGRTPAENAELALLLEVSGTPKPGNVDRERDLPDLRFEHFLAGAVGARRGLELAANGAPVGEAFEQGVAHMSAQSGGNTQFGALLLLVPLVKAAVERELTPMGATAVVEATTVEDAAAFYRAFEHADVFVGDPPEDATAPDVEEGADAVDEIREEGLTMYDVIAETPAENGISDEYTGGFRRTFEAADEIRSLSGPVTARAAATYLDLLAEAPDALVARRKGKGVARQVMVRAQEAREGDGAHVRAFAEALVEEGINPGATADLVAAGLFVALERGLDV